jgi:uridine kinase
MRKYIAIDGKGGSGKTYLANILGERLGAKVFHLDDYGNDYEPFIGLPKLHSEILASDMDCVIYEGVGVFDRRFANLNSYKILVKIPDQVRKDRALSRDVQTSLRTVEEWNKIYAIWAKAEEEYFGDGSIEDGTNQIVGEHDGEFAIDSVIADIKNYFKLK